MTQHGFYFDQSLCSGCNACTVACKNWHKLPPGPLKYLKLYEYEKGSFPNVRVHFQWVPCYHCEAPVCVDACPTGAIYKEPKYGAVLIDEDKCDGCRLCYEACPYGAPVFESDETGAKARKCTMCIDRLESGERPMCTMSCPTHALDFGPLESLITKYGSTRDIEDMPGSAATRPAVVFKPHITWKRQLVAYDAKRAIELMMRRDPLPPIYSSAAEVVEIPKGVVGASELVIKHGSVEELMRRTRGGEG